MHTDNIISSEPVSVSNIGVLWRFGISLAFDKSAGDFSPLTAGYILGEPDAGLEMTEDCN